MTTLESRTPRTNLRPNVGLNLPQFGHSPAHESRTTTESLTEVVRNAVRGVDNAALRPVARRDSGLAFQAPVILAVLTCCYAREIFGSVSIERLMRKDAGFRALCGDEYPDAQTIRCFRRLNRPALQECLEAALRFLDGQAEYRGSASTGISLSAEALRRLDMAACMDMLEFDS
jgi:hypothetical protein